MKRTAYFKPRSAARLMMTACLLILAACGRKDSLFNTSHPDHGTVTLTTEWSGIGEGVTAPNAYNVTATRNGSATTGYSATLTGVTNKLDHLFEPGTYRFCVYNTPEHITVSGTTAIVAQATVTPMDAAPANTPGQMISNAPGWLFTSVVENIEITRDTEHTITTPMHQQVRQLTLIIEPTSDTTDLIERIEGYLTGAASTLDLGTDTHGTPQSVALPFTKITTGTPAGSWSATVRLLGIAGPEQRLIARIHFAGGNPPSIVVNSDLTTQLATFNADKRTPLILNGSVETPPEADLGATITDWERVTGDNPAVAD